MMLKTSFHQRITSRISFGRTNSKELKSPHKPPDTSPTVANLLSQMVSIDDTPFLVSQRKIPPTELPRLDRASIRVGQLVRQGEFTRTFAVVACRQMSMIASTISEDSAVAPASSRKGSLVGKAVGGVKKGVVEVGKASRKIKRSVASFDYSNPLNAPDFSPRQYTVKTHHDFTASRGGDGPNHDLIGTNRNKSKQHQQLLMEAVYLSVLDHDGIVKARAFPILSRTSIFCFTDRISETLEERLAGWRRQRRKAVQRKQLKHERRRRRSRRNSGTQSAPMDQDLTTSTSQEVVALVPEDLVALKTNYALQIANALAYLHDRGIVMRELRPDCVGFSEYPNHHRVQICDLTAAKELPMDEPFLPSTEPLNFDEDESAVSMDNSDMSAASLPSFRRASAISNSGRIPVPSFRRMNTDPTSFRTTSTTTTATGTANSPQQPNQPSFGRTGSTILYGRATDSSSHVSSESYESSLYSGSDDSHRNNHLMNNSECSSGRVMMEWSGRSANSQRTTTMSSSAARDVYRAPEMYAACGTGYNAKVDCFSWAMIYYELLAEKRPLSRYHADTVEQLWEEIRTQRPSMRNLYFPLSIQQVIQKSWEANVSTRYSSKQIAKALTRVLPVLEGKRLDGTRRNGTYAPQRTLPDRAKRVVNSKAAKGWKEIRRPEPVTRARSIATY